MSDEIKTRQKSLQSAIEALQNQNQEISTLQEKKRQFEMGAVNGSSIQEAKVVRRGTIIDFILGKVSRKDLNSANEVLFRAENDDKLTVEMIEELEAILKNMVVQIPILQNAVAMARGELWNAIYESIKREAQAKVGDLSVLAMGAGTHCGKSPQAVLLDLFGTGEGPNKSIHFEIINAAAAGLKKEFGLDD